MIGNLIRVRTEISLAKIVLLNLVASRGVTELYPSRGMTAEHARTAYHTTSETEHQLLHRKSNSQTPYYR